MPNLDTYIIIGAILIVFIIILWIVLRYKKKSRKIELKTDIDQLLIALGGLQNIESVKNERSRVKLVLFDTKKVDSKSLNDMKIPAILKSKEITLLLKDEPKIFVLKIETMKKEVK